MGDSKKAESPYVPKQSSKTRAAARQDESSCSMRNAFASTVFFSCVMCSFLSSSSRCVFIIYIKKGSDDLVLGCGWIRLGLDGLFRVERRDSSLWNIYAQ